MAKPQATSTKIRLDSAPGAFIITAQWTGIGGCEDLTYDCYDITVTDSDATLVYVKHVPHKGQHSRRRLSVQDMARAFAEILSQAAFDYGEGKKVRPGDMRPKLLDLEVTAERYTPMIQELNSRYKLNTRKGNKHEA